MPRRVTGLVLALAGLPVLVLALIGWGVLRHSDHGAFTAELAPVHTSGYAIVVPDVAELVSRHGAGAWLGASRIRVAASSPDGPVRVAVAPADATRRLLDGVSRAELAGVGFAAGQQPVELVELLGTRQPQTLTPQPLVAAGEAVEWDLASPDPMSLILIRADGRSGIDAALTVSLRPGWLGLATWGCLLGGGVCLIIGLVLVLDRRSVPPGPHEWPYEPVPAPRHALTRGHDLTGELVTVPSWEYGRPDGESPYIYTAT